MLKKDYISFKSHGNLVALALKGVNLSLTIEKGHAKIKIRLSRGERRSFMNKAEGEGDRPVIWKKREKVLRAGHFSAFTADLLPIPSLNHHLVSFPEPGPLEEY